MNQSPKFEKPESQVCDIGAERVRVTLDDYNSDLNFLLENDGLTGSSLHKEGFECLWAGARATHGVSTGKVCYEVLIQEKLEVNMSEIQTSTHVSRVGWSIESPDLTLGESGLSYGYGGTGKMSCNNKFLNYGEPFSTNDVIMCYIDLNAVPKTIFFAKNGKYLGVAFQMGPEADGKVFYPHITVKNMRFVVNFGGVQPYFPPLQGFSLMESLSPTFLSVPLVSFKDPKDCEVLMMVGLPSCGKTTWADKFVKDHPHKKYYLLGTNEILCKMKVMGLTRKRNYHGRWDALIKQATGVLNEMLKISQRKCRNYILDQTNVYPNARRRKMNNFRHYRHFAVVIVNTNSVMEERNQKAAREDGKVIPESAIMEMKANFTLPVEGAIFDEVWYVEENREKSEELVREFNEEGKAWKEDQKKRLLDDATSNDKSTFDVKRPRNEPPASGNPHNDHQKHGQYSNQSWNQGNNVRQTESEDGYKKGSFGFKPNNFGQMNVRRGKNESYTQQDNYPSDRPPLHTSYHNQHAPSNNHYSNTRYPGNQTEQSYHNPAHRQQYDQQFFPLSQNLDMRLSNQGGPQRPNYETQPNYAQPQFPLPYQNEMQHRNSFENHSSNYADTQGPGGYFDSRQHNPYPPVKEETSYSQERSGHQEHGYQEKGYPSLQGQQPGYQEERSGYQEQQWPGYQEHGYQEQGYYGYQDQWGNVQRY